MIVMVGLAILIVVNQLQLYSYIKYFGFIYLKFDIYRIHI